MVEFNTDEDLHTIMKYKRHEQNIIGGGGIITVDIEALSACLEEYCKVTADMWLYQLLYARR